MPERLMAICTACHAILEQGNEAFGRHPLPCPGAASLRWRDRAVVLETVVLMNLRSRLADCSDHFQRVHLAHEQRQQRMFHDDIGSVVVRVWDRVVAGAPPLAACDAELAALEAL